MNAAINQDADLQIAEADKAMLRARAQELARVPEDPPAPDTLLHVLEFALASERYAVEAKFVREVYPLKDLSPLPCAPSFVAGVVNVRGRILPVLDLRRFFDLPGRGITDLHRVILVQGNDLEFGLLADVVTGMVTLPLGRLQTTLPAMPGIQSQFLKGVTADCLIVIDLARVMADPGIVIHEEM